MNNNDTITINPNTSVWIYNLTKSDYEDYIKYNNKSYITFMDTNKIEKNDVIMLYQKDRTSGGFAGILQSDSQTQERKKNIKINIFKNESMHNFYTKIKQYIQFPEFIDIATLLKSLNSNSVGFKNTTGFKVKFLKKDNNIIKFDSHSKQIYDIIFDIYKQQIKNKKIEQDNEQEDEQDNEQEDEQDNEEEDGQDKDQEIEQDNEEDEDDNEEDSKYGIHGNDLLSLSDNEDDNCENDSDNEENDESDDNCESESSDDDEIMESEEGFIPIMIVPCKKYKIPQLNPELYFKNHYKTCEECDITNNNKKELHYILDKATIEIFELKDTKHYHFNPAMECYHAVRRYEPLDIKKRPFIRCIYINNNDEMYNKCLLITWID